MSALTKHIPTWLLAILAIFAPIKAAVITAMVLVIADLITGLLAAHKQQQPITSTGLKRTIGKILLYEAAILLGFLAETYMTGSLLPISKLITSVIGLTEVKSCLENLQIINPAINFSSLVTKITGSTDKLP